MKHPKPARVVDLALIRQIQKMPCRVCGYDLGVDAHHLVTKRLRGDLKTNLLPLCRKHHMEVHSEGVKTFVEKYKIAVTWEGGYPELISSET